MFSQMTEKQKMYIKHKRKGIFIFLSLLFMLALGFIGVKVSSYLNRPRVKEMVTVEVGSALPDISLFLLEQEDAFFSIPLEEIVNMNELSDYEVAVTVGGKEYISVLHLVDTTAPEVEVRETEIYTDEELNLEDLILRIDDCTETKSAFACPVRLAAAGIYYIPIVVTDLGGNSVWVWAKVHVLKDMEPPVITGVQELSIKAGENISYKRGVKVSDNHDQNVKLEIDNSTVNLNKVGDYQIVYSAEDNAGNRTEIPTVLHILEPGVEGATEEIVNAEADAILAEITTEDMTQYEVAKAIFDWIYNNIKNTNVAPKTTWVEGAYRGLFERKGDCFVYAMTSKCLLTRAGIPNMDIGFKNPNRMHYWNLIDLGEGWYHWDVTKRINGDCFFYVSDDVIRAYSSIHNGSHAYDPSKYPEIQ